MRRIILLTALALVAGSGAAFADHYRGGNERADHRNRVTFRTPHDRVWTHRDHRVVYRRPVYAANGYYQFDNGYRYRYARPVIQRRYFDYRVRPQIIVENYQPVAGYVWIPGQWQWNGYEWSWSAGYYQVDPAYRSSGYGAPGYSDSGYSDSGYSDSGYSDSGYSDSGYSDSGYSDPGCNDHGAAPAYDDSVR